jgi:hypothetical protein
MVILAIVREAFMKKIYSACVFLLLTFTACHTIPIGKTFPGNGMRPLGTVELIQPGVSFIFPSGKKYETGAVFAPPKTIDCSGLALQPDGFRSAIDAGALIIKLQTPPKIERVFKNESGKETTEVVKIKPAYGGVLALCNVSDRASGPDSRSYRIRGLDEYLIKGKDGLISVVGAVIDIGAGQSNSRVTSADPLQLLLNGALGGAADISHYQHSPTTGFSWMLWLTDRTVTFTDYQTEVAGHHTPIPQTK